MAGWGAAVWPASATGLGSGPPAAEARGFLGPGVTNNVAEYRGLLECMMRAMRRDDQLVLFEVDSMLLAMQMAQHRPWACRSESLIDLHVGCVEAGTELTRSDKAWRVRHVYREFNQVADSLANASIDEWDTNGVSANW